MLNWDNEVESIEMLEVELSAMTPARDQHSKQTIHNLIRHILFYFFFFRWIAIQFQHLALVCLSFDSCSSLFGIVWLCYCRFSNFYCGLSIVSSLRKCNNSNTQIIMPENKRKKRHERKTKMK